MIRPATRSPAPPKSPRLGGERGQTLAAAAADAFIQAMSIVFLATAALTFTAALVIAAARQAERRATPASAAREHGR